MKRKARSLRRSRRKPLILVLKWERSLALADELARDDVMYRDGLRMCWPRRGQYRALAAHLAMEAFDLRPYQLAKISGVDRRHVSRAHTRWWNNRDAWGDLNERLEDAIARLREGCL